LACTQTPLHASATLPRRSLELDHEKAFADEWSGVLELRREQGQLLPDKDPATRIPGSARDVDKSTEPVERRAAVNALDGLSDRHCVLDCGRRTGRSRAGEELELQL